MRVIWCSSFRATALRRVGSSPTESRSFKIYANLRTTWHQDSVFSITDFLKTRKSSRTWERFRYGLCSGVVQRMLETYVSPHRLREKARRLRETIGQHKYVAPHMSYSLRRIRFC